MFRQFRLYTHKNMLDCAILVLKSYRAHDGQYELEIQWFNRRGMNLGFIERVTITRDQVKNWYELNP
jgi:hypothetical protein